MDQGPLTCTTEQKLRIVEALPFLQGLSTVSVRKIGALFHDSGFDRGEQIYRVGTPASQVYVVAAGVVKLVQPTEEGRDVVLDLLAPGEHFGHLPVEPGSPYPCSAVAHTPCCVLSIDNSDIRQTLEDEPPVAVALFQLTMEKLNVAWNNIQHLSGDPPRKRIAGKLVFLARKFGEPVDDGVLIRVEISRQDLADMCGVTQETASRCVSSFQREGFLKSGRKWISITDIDRLAGIASA